MKRRDWFKLIGAASGTTVVAGCKKVGTEKLIPYLVPPDDGIIPGEAHYVHTTCTECPAGCGLTARIVDGYPVKLEGRKGHPINDGRLCMRGQASLTRLYHPNRIKNPLRKVKGKWEDVSWDEAYDLIRKGLADAKKQGKRNIWLSGRTTGTLSELIDEFCEKMGVERWPEYEPISYATIRKANEIVFGQPVIPDYRIDKADFLLTIGADILETFVSPVLFARRLEEARKNPDFRWVHVEPHVSLTGLQADERVVVKPGSEVPFVAFLVTGLMSEWLNKDARERDSRWDPVCSTIYHLGQRQSVSQRSGLSRSVLHGLVEQFWRSHHSLVILGGPAVSLTAAVLTAFLQYGICGPDETLEFVDGPTAGRADPRDGADRLRGCLEADEVGVLITSGVRFAPGVRGLSGSPSRAMLRIALSDLIDPTIGECHLLLPTSHALEHWGDARPRPDLMEAWSPVVSALHSTRSAGDILLGLLTASPNHPTGGYAQYLRRKWLQNRDLTDADRLAADGYQTVPVKPVRLERDVGRLSRFFEGREAPRGSTPPSLIVVPSPRWYDGRSRVLPLLEEIPDPLTTVTYGDWILVGEGTARKLGLKDGDHVKIAKGDWSAELPIKTHPLLQDDVYVVHMGMLDDVPMRIDEETGEADWVLPGIEVTRTGRHTKLPIMAFSTSQEGRGVIPDPVPVGQGDHGHDHDDHEQEHEEGHGLFAKPGAYRDKSMYPPHDHNDYQWAMVVDLDKCTGCGACAAACQIENNIPVVGLKDHLKGREMSWIRIEPRYEEKEGVAIVSFTPMMCQHCHNAPCEPVCPVFATVHNEEGLNAQIYNRCVGTRYCANNCPYKVRRFNWFDHPREEPLDKMVNPDMLLRSRGVMEKCTFCVQRIRAARDHAKDEQRLIRDGEVIPACAQTCPSDAIAFGNLKDARSEASKLIQSERAFRVFEHLNTDPSVYYLRKKVRSV
jgi:molybdopterin-containing oxidoreductase family iron-sulfur binding subunit